LSVAVTVLHADNLEQVSALLTEHKPGYAVVDLKLNGNASGLACVQMLNRHNEDMLIVVLTGFASIATAVEAVKLGACQYLAKPSNTDDIEAAFGHVAGVSEPELPNRATSIKTLEWERIHEVLVDRISIFQKLPAGSVCTGELSPVKLSKQQVR
jgi:two-component system response regulator RegA